MVQFTSWTWRLCWALFMQRLELMQGKHSTVVCVKVQPLFPIGSMYGIYTNIGGILMVNVTIYGIHGSVMGLFLRLALCPSGDVSKSFFDPPVVL